MGHRNNKFVLNSMFSFIQQLVIIVCGLILPQIILHQFGSAVNGLTASIVQFLSLITLLQGGVGTVARLSFYKPLAQDDKNQISVAYKTVSRYYRKFSAIFIIYLIVLSILYPLFVKTGFSFAYVAMLVLILGFATIFEYFFGQASQMLIFSGQCNYIFSVIQIMCTIISTIIGIILVRSGASIHIVKLVSAVVFALRPLVLYKYVTTKYKINKNVEPDERLLSQRKAALVRHIAFYIHTSTDIMVLTMCSNMLCVSVYAIHGYVVNSIANLVSAVIGNTEVVFGDMIAKNENEIMKKQVPIYDLFTKILSCSCFFTCMILITRFVMIYTKGVGDIDYRQPVFAVLIVMAEMIYCMGVNYQNIYIAAGHIKKTEWIAITEAVINLGVSIVLVWKFSIVGVALGTLSAMCFKSIANIYYMKKNVFDLSMRFIVMSYIVNLGTGFILVTLFWTVFYIELESYIQFFAFAIITFAVVTVILVAVNAFVFKKEMSDIFWIIKLKMSKKGVVEKSEKC